jgi:hypothetical protein
MIARRLRSPARTQMTRSQKFSRKISGALQLHGQFLAALTAIRERFVKVLNSSVEIHVEIHSPRFSSPLIRRVSAVCTISVQ